MATVKIGDWELDEKYMDLAKEKQQYGFSYNKVKNGIDINGVHINKEYVFRAIDKLLPNNEWSATRQKDATEALGTLSQYGTQAQDIYNSIMGSVEQKNAGKLSADDYRNTAKDYSSQLDTLSYRLKRDFEALEAIDPNYVTKELTQNVKDVNSAVKQLQELLSKDFSGDPRYSFKSDNEYEYLWGLNASLPAKALQKYESEGKQTTTRANQIIYNAVNGLDIGNEMIFGMTPQTYVKNNFLYLEYLSPEEIAVYNGIAGKYGVDAARGYLNTLEQDAMQRAALDKADTINSKSGLAKQISKTGLSIWGGLEGAAANSINALKAVEGAAPEESLYSLASQYSRRNDTGFEKVFHDVMNTTANMIPAVAASVLPGGQALGAATIGAQSAGGAYADAMNSGYDVNQARLYGVANGALEAGLNYLLGGIGKFGKFSASKLLNKVPALQAAGDKLKAFLPSIIKSPAIQNVLASSGHALARMGDEALEEYLQAVIDPFLRNLALNENNSIDLLSDEALYSGFLGALTAGMMNAPQTVSDVVTGIRDGRASMAIPNSAVTDIQSDIRQAPNINTEIDPTTNLTADMPFSAWLEAGERPTVTDADIEAVQRVATALNAKVEFVDTLNGLNGRYNPETGVITIARDAKSPALTAMKHELTHSLQGSDSYAKLTDFVMNSAEMKRVAGSQGLTIDALVEAKVWEYGQAGINLSQDGAIQEIVADFAGDRLFTDESAVRRLTAEHRSLSERILDWIRRVKVRLFGTNEQVFLQKAENLYLKALNQRGDAAAPASVKTDAQASIGAGDFNDQYAELLKKYKAFQSGENPFRAVEVPTKTADNGNVSRGVRTIMESQAVPDAAIPPLQEALVNEAMSYEVLTDNKALQDANSIISQGYDHAMQVWNDAAASDRVATKQDLVLGQRLIQLAGQQRDIDTLVRLVAEVSAEATRAGQTVQAMRMLKRLTPEGSLLYVQKAVDQLNGDKKLKNKVNKKTGRRKAEIEKEIVELESKKRKQPVDENAAVPVDQDIDLQINELQKELETLSRDFVVPDETVEDILSQTTPEGLEDAVLRAWDTIAAQIEPKLSDKITAWRYLAMLANVKTHGRNIIGNAVFMPMVYIKDLIGAATETVVDKVSQARGKFGINRTKSLETILPGTGRDYKAFARNDFDSVSDVVMGGDKMSPYNEIQSRKQVFKFRPLESLRETNSKLLNVEDKIFSKMHYTRAMAGFLAGNNVDLDTITSQDISKARAYAVQEAQKATYRDASALATFLNEVSRKSKVAGVLIEANLPFKKTPFNIAKRAVEYSPIGLMNGLTRNAVKLKNGDINTAQFISSLSAGLTGTGVMALGVLLASLGWLDGAIGDDDEGRLRKLMGEQEYAINLPGGFSYTLDWMAPVSMPLFAGVELFGMMDRNNDEMELKDVFESLALIGEPLIEMSMLQGINNTLEQISYSDNKLSDLFMISVANYMSQFVPTIIGQTARTIDDTRRRTYIDKDSALPSQVDYALQKNKNKIPFVSQHSQPYIDEWGRDDVNENWMSRAFENYLSPGYMSKDKTSNVEQELQRLYDATGEGSVIPATARKYFTVDGQRYDLSAADYTKYARIKGQKSLELINELIQSTSYKSLDDTAKAEVVKQLYDYANALAKASVSPYQLSTSEEKIKAASDNGIKVSHYLIYQVSTRDFTADKDENGKTLSGTKKAKILEYIDSMPFTKAQKDELYLQNGYSESELPNAPWNKKSGQTTQNSRSNSYSYDDIWKGAYS